jgi:lysozyme family protein
MANAYLIIPHVLKWEGGLSRNPADSASKNPAPCAYNGKTGYHTNKGVTYTTFTSLAKSLNYDPTCENFFIMPEDIFLKIFKTGYWNGFKLDEYKSQKIANVIVSWAWASGAYGAYKQLKKFFEKQYNVKLVGTYNENINTIKDLFNKETEIDETAVYNKLIEAYRNFYISLNQPTFIKGWLNRLTDLDTFNIAFEVVKKNPFKTIAILAITAFAIKKAL